MAEPNDFVGDSIAGGGTSLASEGRVSSPGAGAVGSPLAIGGAEMQGQVFKSLADHSQEFIGLCDLQFKPFYLNEAGMKLVGLDSLEEACVARVQDFFFPEDQRFINEEFFPKVLREGAGEAEIRFRHFKTGAALWMIFNVYQVRDARGQVSGYATVSRDITERKRAEEAVRSAALFPEENPNPVARVDAEGKLLFANRASSGLLAEWQCKVGQRVPGVVLGAVQRALQATRAQELEISAGGRRVSFVLMPIGERGYVNLYGRDITEQKQAEERLRESESRAKVAQAVEAERQRFRDVLNKLPAYVALLSPDYHVPFANRFFEERFGKSNGRRCFEYLFERTEPCENCETFKVLATGSPHDWEWTGPDGRHYEVHDFPFTDADGSRMIMEVGMDITEFRRTQAALKEANDRLVERSAKLQELVGELEHFSYTITHDMRAPLRAMRGFGEAVQEWCAQCPHQEPRHFLRRIMVGTVRMDALIRDALQYSRSVRQELPLEEVDTGALLRGMVDTYPELQAAGAVIRLEGELAVVLGNEAGLTQCFSNLLGNAVKYVKPGEKAEIRIWAEERDGWTRLWVEDKGIGIPRALLPRVFDMFSRGHNTYEGTGIGLALVRKVTQRMGGKVGVESEEGKGSRFWIELKSGEARAFAAATARQREGAGAGEGTVLYVEDEESDAMFMTMAFKGKGLAGKLRLVATGRAAIDYLSGSGEFGDRGKYPRPALVLLDLNLPQVSGFGVLEWIRNNPDYARLPVVVFSSSTREDDRVRAKELGADDFVAKPSSGLKFGEVVEGLRERWLGRRPV